VLAHGQIRSRERRASRDAALRIHRHLGVGAVGPVVVLDVELELEAGEVRPRQGLQAQVVEVVVGVEEAQDGEIFGRLEDPRDRDTRGGGVVKRCRRGLPGEALYVHVTARVEHVERFGSHKCGECKAARSGRCRRRCRTWLPLHSYEGVALGWKSRDIHDHYGVTVGERVRHLHVELVKTGGTEAGPQHLRL